MNICPTKNNKTPLNCPRNMRTEQKSPCVETICFALDAIVVIKIDIAVDHFVGFAEGSRFMTMDTLRLRNREKIFAIALSYKFLCLDIECVIPYC